ncbi:MAG: cache domain-containing protein [Desulfobacterales bacterium]|nr:cache domain-containing protein [Desulfobacterales bacterium]
MFSSIRSKLISVLIIFGGLPLLVVGYLSYESASRALLLQTQEQLGNVADKTAQQIDDFFEAAEKDIFILSNSLFVQLSFLQHEFGQKLNTVRRLLVNYGELHKYFHRISLVSVQGKTILTAPEQVGEPAPVRFGEADWFQSAIRDGRYISDVVFRENDLKSIIILAQAVYDFEDPGKVVGVIAFDINLQAFTGYVQSLKIGSRGYGFLLHNQGYLIYHPEEKMVLGTEFLEGGDNRFTKHVQKMTRGEKGFGDYLFNGTEKYLVYAPCRSRGWTVAISVQKSELMAEISKLRRRVTTFVSIILGLIVPVSFLFIRGVTRPIGQLIRGASAIGKGDLDQIIDIRSSEELKALADEYNRMARQLKASMGQILELKAFQEDILRSVSSGIITVDRHCKLTSLNESARKILPHQPIREDGGIETVRGAALTEIMRLLQRTVEGGERIQHKELTLTREDGALRSVEVNTALLKDREDRVLGAIADVRDITSRKRMEERMGRIDNLASLGELSAGVAHEILNPLAGMKVSVQVLAKRRTNDAEKILIEGILDEIKRLNRIVTELLRFSRPSPPVFKPVDPSIILDKALDLVSEEIRSNHIRLKSPQGEPLFHVLADQEQVQQVFLNLLLNAMKAMPGGGDLTITVEAVEDTAEPANRLFHEDFDEECMPGRFVRIVFKDTGYGIRQEDLPKVFNPFYTTDPGGTGLGLSIAHKLIEKNRGTIHIESKEGKGTQVIVLLPVANDS